MRNRTTHSIVPAYHLWDPNEPCPRGARRKVQETMQLYFVRHGEPDYGSLRASEYGPLAPDLAPLTPIGRVQIDTIANDFRLQQVDAVLSSSYARALESAALLARAIGRPFYVEVDLHEWRPHLDVARQSDPELIARASKRLRFGQDPGEGPWETLDEVRRRAVRVLRRYQRFERLAIVTHAVVIASIVGSLRPFEHAEIVPFEFDPDASPPLPDVVHPNR